jgi:hypothetical protein
VAHELGHATGVFVGDPVYSDSSGTSCVSPPNHLYENGSSFCGEIGDEDSQEKNEVPLLMCRRPVGPAWIPLGESSEFGTDDPDKYDWDVYWSGTEWRNNINEEDVIAWAHEEAYSIN